MNAAGFVELTVVETATSSMRTKLYQLSYSPMCVTLFSKTTLEILVRSVEKCNSTLRVLCFCVVFADIFTTIERCLFGVGGFRSVLGSRLLLAELGLEQANDCRNQRQHKNRNNH